MTGAAPGSNARVIRVFVSSTFRDMGAERDELVKRTFPALRQLCESRGVTWGEVDLRWGITEEQKAEGRVLPICLAEIASSRPYFIGLLGQRYGWVPTAIEGAALENEPWLAECAGRSVTELEILHGVLNDPAMASHAFFYLRDPAYAEGLPPEQYRESEPEPQARLAALKERIRGSGLPVREDYPDPRALGELVLADLSSLIERFYPAGSEPDPLDRERAEHEAFARSRAGVYIGRPEYFSRLDAHAARDGTPLVVIGDSGSGKSALLANWAIRYRAGHADELVLTHFIGASPASTDWASMVRRLIGELNARFNLAIDMPEGPEALRLAFANALHMAAARGRVVLVIDALNGLEDREAALDLGWLPPLIPANVRVVTSSLPGRALDEARKRGYSTLPVAPLEASERERLIVDYLAGYSRALGAAMRDRIAASSQCANPLYLRALLDELRVWGEHETLGARIDHYLAADSVDALYGLILARYEQDYQRDRPNLVGDALSLLWSARRGLSETELLELLGTGGDPIARAFWSPLYLAAAQSLTNRSGLLGFFHDYLRAAVEHRYLPDERAQRTAHLRLADYFAARELGPRKIDELPWQLARAGSWDRLADQLADTGFLEGAWNADQFEVKAFWAQVEASSGRRLVDGYRTAIERPDRYPDRHIRILGRLLTDTGHTEEALFVRSVLVDHDREAGDLSSLQASLGGQAIVLHLRGDPDGAWRLFREQERICRAIGNQQGLQASLGNQALVLRARGDLDGALALHAEQERICRSIGDGDGLHTSLANRALILKARGDLDGAMTLQQENERYWREVGNWDGLQRSLGNQGLIRMTRGDLDGAMALFAEEERVSRELGSKGGVWTSLVNQGLVLRARGDLDGAMALFVETERLCRELGDKAGLGKALGSQALVLRTRGRLDEAMALLRKDEEICRELGDKEGLQIALGNQANILYARRDLAGAMTLHKENERICRELGNKDELQICLGNQGAVLVAGGDLRSAMALFQEQERVCRELGIKRGLQAALANQATLLYTLGELDRSTVVRREEEQLCRELGNKGALGRSLGNQALVRKARGDLDGAMRLLQEQERICRDLGDRDELQVSLCNQAGILYERDDPEGAMALLAEQQRLCREIGNPEGLARCLANQAVLMGSSPGHSRQALALAEEAFELAHRHGLNSLALQIRAIADRQRFTG